MCSKYGKRVIRKSSTSHKPILNFVVLNFAEEMQNAFAYYIISQH